MRKKGLLRLAAVCLGGVLAATCAAKVLADDTHWILAPPDVGDWFDEANWDDGIPAYAHGSDAYIDNGGTAHISAETASWHRLHVGYHGYGMVTQEGGQARAYPYYGGCIYLGYWPEASGTYSLSHGALAPHNLDVGFHGSGEVIQTGGALTCNNVTIGYYEGRGTYLHSQGTLTTPKLYLGNGKASHGLYHLSGDGSLSVADTLYVARCESSQGEFLQTGGTVTIGGAVEVGLDDGAQGTVSLAGGSFSAGRFEVGVGQGNAAFHMAGRTPSVHLSEALQLGRNAVMTCVPGAAIHMTGAAFENESTNPDALAGLGNLELIFEGGPAETDPVEVAGEDRGPVWDGFIGNFTFGGLTVGGAEVGQVRLVDDSDNGNRGGPVGTDEAQYVKRLRVGPGSTLDLGGLNLYCLCSAIDPSATILTGGGSLTKVPAIEAVSATVLATTFSPTGGAHGLGILALDDVADIVLETDDGLQTTYAGGTVALETYLFSDDSSGGLASGLFCDGTILLTNAGGDDLLAADLLELRLDEMPDQHLLAGAGRFEITGGSLQGGFPYTVGEVVQITFQVDPSGTADFASPFKAVSDVTLTPEPATLVLLAAGAVGMLARRRRRR